MISCETVARDEEAGANRTYVMAVLVLSTVAHMTCLCCPHDSSLLLISVLYFTWSPSVTLQLVAKAYPVSQIG